MKWVNHLEKKLFPNDSPYQRIRKRYAAFFSLVGVFVIIWGAATTITKVSGLAGRKIDNTQTRTIMPSWP
jgi:hypothetical protein